MKEFLQDLLHAPSFEDAALLTLKTMLGAAAATLATSPLTRSGRIVRAMIHMRPSDGYRHLVVLAAGADTLSAPGADDRLLPSATAWRWVVEHGRPISVDVFWGRFTVDGVDGAKTFASGGTGVGQKLSSDASLFRLQRRDVTHLHVLPLRSGCGSLIGMVSIEAFCEDALGHPAIWSACTAQLQTLADVATPHFTVLPASQARPRPKPDELLPVVGSTMAAGIAMLRIFAQQEEPLLISGPTGAGKSRLARWCHEQSPQRGAPFEVLDLSSIPEELQMAELFGWKKGAFTGAVRDNAGLIARAFGGTLFIDEIDNLSPRAQAGLLRVLEERSYRVLGDDRGEKPAQVRFIIGTNASLETAVREKRFRADLYYRINVLPVRLPPLNERRDEVPLWAHYMANRRHAKRVPEGEVALTPGAQAALAAHSWPGNLRQLDNIVRRAYAITVMPFGGAPPHRLVIEEEHVRRALAYEGVADPGASTLDVILSAASSIVSAAESRAGGEPLDIDLIDGFKGIVLCAALEKLGGNRDELFRLFGREGLVKSRNHHRALKREAERSLEFWEAVSPGVPFPFTRVLLSDDSKHDD